MEWWILLCSCIRTWTLAFQCLGLKLRLLTIWLWKGEIQQVWPERKAWSGVDADLSSLKLKKCLRSSLMENNTKCLIFTIYTKTYQHITRSPWSALERTRPWQVMGTEVYFLKLNASPHHAGLLENLTHPALDLPSLLLTSLTRTWFAPQDSQIPGAFGGRSWWFFTLPSLQGLEVQLVSSLFSLLFLGCCFSTLKYKALFIWGQYQLLFFLLPAACWFLGHSIYCSVWLRLSSSPKQVWWIKIATNFPLPLFSFPSFSFIQETSIAGGQQSQGRGYSRREFKGILILFRVQVWVLTVVPKACLDCILYLNF